jgi:hypothetical protein
MTSSSVASTPQCREAAVSRPRDRFILHRGIERERTEGVASAIRADSHVGHLPKFLRLAAGVDFICRSGVPLRSWLPKALDDITPSVGFPGA